MGMRKNNIGTVLKTLQAGNSFDSIARHGRSRVALLGFCGLRHLPGILGKKVKGILAAS